MATSLINTMCVIYHGSAFSLGRPRKIWEEASGASPELGTVYKLHPSRHEWHRTPTLYSLIRRQRTLTAQLVAGVPPVFDAAGPAREDLAESTVKSYRGAWE